MHLSPAPAQRLPSGGTNTLHAKVELTYADQSPLLPMTIACPTRETEVDQVVDANEVPQIREPVELFGPCAMP